MLVAQFDKPRGKNECTSRPRHPGLLSVYNFTLTNGSRRHKNMPIHLDCRCQMKREHIARLVASAADRGVYLDFHGRESRYFPRGSYSSRLILSMRGSG